MGIFSGSSGMQSIAKRLQVDLKLIIAMFQIDKPFSRLQVAFASVSAFFEEGHDLISMTAA